MATTDRIGDAAEKTAAELENDEPGWLRDAVETVKSGVDTVKSGAGQVVERLPDLAEEARSGAAGTAETFEAMPQATLQIVTAASLGFGAALFLAGAPRLITLLSLVPAIFAAGTIVGRQSRASEGD
jgi:hypothetical protein